MQISPKRNDHKADQAVIAFVGERQIKLPPGRFSQTFLALHEAGPAGITSLEVSSWALRLAHYIFVLRRRWGLNITTTYEAHDGGEHARYKLVDHVRILEGAPGAARAA